MIFIRIILIKLKWKSLEEFINDIKRLEKVLQSLKGLKDDKEIVLKAIELNGDTFQFVSARLKDD